MYTFTIPRDEFDELRPDKQMIRKLIGKHIGLVGRLKMNMNYYRGKHKILDDENRENKLVCNHAKDISDTASSYFIGNPVSYKSENDITELTKALEVAGADEVDGDNGLDLSIYGLAYEYIYVKENEAYLCDKNISAENTFMVRDDSIEENELFAVYYYAKKDDSGTKTTQYMATILTQNYKFEFQNLAQYSSSSSMQGFETKLTQTTTDLRGMTDGTFLYNTKCQDNGDGTTTVSAALYKAGREVTKEYPAACFSWSRRTEQGEAFLQYGYSVTVNNDDYMFGGVVIGQFIRYVQMALTVGDKILVIGNRAMCVNVDA